MNPRRIERYLKLLAERLDTPATIYLTGACAAALWGRVRPSLDIDFGIEPGRGARKDWAELQAAVLATSALTGIPASAAADIDRWGMITLLDYRRTARTRFRFGRVTVKLLHPITWSIGKLTRFIEPDVRDVAAVFRSQRIGARAAASTWGRALRASPPSTAQFQFRCNVEIFLQEEGRRIWGKSFTAEPLIAVFHRAARIAGRGTRGAPDRAR